jgi:VIT1/CCC1 family predicted Fe2+/Mn2+ transporter
LSLAVATTALLSLAALGGFAARMGGARIAPAAARVTFWGALAMGLTAGVGFLLGTTA